ncbi:SH3 domain-containing protein [Marimonas sp. MJW-29]
MINECSSVGQTYFRDFTARTDMRYNGQRVDGTHAINGRIFLETRFEDFACSYNRNGRRMTEFFAEGRVQNAFLPGAGSAGQGSSNAGQGSVVQVTGLRQGDTLNVRSGPGTNNRIVGALSNGTSVRNLGCQMQGGTRWCQIEMMTDMRERGWVAGRYLTLAGAAPAPEAGPVVRVTGVAANDVLNVRAGPGTRYGVIGALPNGASVRNLGCQTQGAARWCQIEMMTDIRERGWVNARFLTGQAGQATQLPSLSRTQRIRFQPGASGTEFSDSLPAGATVTYLLGARNGQTLSVELAGAAPNLFYRIFNPDGRELLGAVNAGRFYRGQLWQSGDYRIEVMNRGGRSVSYTALIRVR